MIDYNQAFEELVNQAINDGWHPVWIDRCEGNHIYLKDDFEDIGETPPSPSVYFYFISPQEWEEM